MAPRKTPERKLIINNGTGISIGLGLAAILAVAGLAKDKGRIDERVDTLSVKVDGLARDVQLQDQDNSEVKVRLAAIETKLNIVMNALGVDDSVTVHKLHHQ